MADISTEDWVRMKDCVERLDKTVNGNGKPPLETRLREYVDSRDQHKEKNSQQDLQDFRDEQDDKHKQNRTTLDKIDSQVGRVEKLVYIGLGIVITLESLGLFKSGLHS